ncbi:MAG: hypothetical protein Q8L60_02685 [Gammaproteobacteria bacterium]|nr:hypothetical protein [Gammaproteobacteria bacterium]MDP2348006.1 hypothetical protein [Gammaproteobacteria bacterium]
MKVGRQHHNNLIASMVTDRVAGATHPGINVCSMATPLLSIGVLICAFSAPASAQSLTEDIASMVSGGTTRIAMRYRFEDVEQDNALDNATASTLRTRLTFQSAVVNKFSVAIEVDNILTIGPDDYDSFALDKYRGNHSVIADPVGTEINVATVKYALSDTSSASIGRQRYNHLTQRFLGSVGFRQNEQTMDSFSYNRVSGNVTVDYSYLWNVNRVFKGSKKSAQITDYDSNSHALLISGRESWGTLSGFIYALDFDNALTASSISYGLYYTGVFGAFTLNASYAAQSDYGDNPISYDTDYLLLEGSTKVGAVTLLAGYEVLGSDSGRIGFATPLATLHRYQGFADMFLATPANGIEDFYLTASAPVGKANLSVTYHDYGAEETSADYGSEINVVAGYIVNPRLNFEAKFATYDSDGFAVDTDKLWLTVNLAF